MKLISYYYYYILILLVNSIFHHKGDIKHSTLNEKGMLPL